MKITRGKKIQADYTGGRTGLSGLQMKILDLIVSLEQLENDEVATSVIDLDILLDEATDASNKINQYLYN